METDVILSCPDCGENFHQDHLTIWLRIDGSCPICKHRILSSQEVSKPVELLFEDDFKGSKLKQEWEVVEEQSPAFELLLGGYGLQGVPLSTEGGSTKIRKVLHPSANNIRFIAEFKFYREGSLFLSGYTKNREQLFRLGIEKTIASTSIYHPYSSEALYVPNSTARNLMFIQVHLMQRSRKATLILSVIDQMQGDKYDLADIVDSIGISFGKEGKRSTANSLWRVIKYDERIISKNPYFS